MRAYLIGMMMIGCSLFYIQFRFLHVTANRVASCERKRLSLREKIEILEFYDLNPKIGVQGVAAKFSVSKTQISDIVKSRDELNKVWVANGDENRKWTKRQKTDTSVINDEVLHWFTKLYGRESVLCQLVLQ